MSATRLLIADLDDAGGHRHIGGGQRRAAEDACIATSAGSRRCPGPDVTGPAHDAAAAEPDRIEVRHAEQRAHPADLDDRIGLARKAAAQLPTSVEVPPTSTTIASASPDRKAAPRIELVAPDAKLMTGSAVAASADITVPSFWVR